MLGVVFSRQGPSVKECFVEGFFVYLPTPQQSLGTSWVNGRAGKELAPEEWEEAAGVRVGGQGGG